MLLFDSMYNNDTYIVNLFSLFKASYSSLYYSLSSLCRTQMKRSLQTLLKWWRS